MLSRLTVPPLRSVITSAPPLAALGTWNSLRWEWPPKSGSWSMMRIFLSGPKRSWYHFAAEIPLAPAPTITQSYFSRVSFTRAWMPGPPLVEWICDGFDGGGAAILIVRRVTRAGSAGVGGPVGRGGVAEGGRVVAGGQRRVARVPVRHRLGAGQAREGRRGGEPGRADRGPVEEVAARDPVLLFPQLALVPVAHPDPPFSALA